MGDSSLPAAGGPALIGGDTFPGPLLQSGVGHLAGLRWDADLPLTGRWVETRGFPPSSNMGTDLWGQHVSMAMGETWGSSLAQKK